MGGCKESLLNTVERDLKKAYRAEEGWNLERLSGNGECPAYLLIKRRVGEKERVLVHVRVAASVGTEEFSLLGDMAAHCAEEGKPASRVMLVVPQDVVLSTDPGTVDLFYLPSYSVKNGEVLWSKSNLWTADGRPVLEKS